jgi:hypothetical protein
VILQAFAAVAAEHHHPGHYPFRVDAALCAERSSSRISKLSSRGAAFPLLVPMKWAWCQQFARLEVIASDLFGLSGRDLLDKMPIPDPWRSNNAFTVAPEIGDIERFSSPAKLCAPGRDTQMSSASCGCGSSRSCDDAPDAAESAPARARGEPTGRAARSPARDRATTAASTRASMRSVLHASGARPLTLLSIGDQHLPAVLLKRVVHKARAVHRLDHRAHTLIMQAPH